MDAKHQDILNVICYTLADAYRLGGQVLNPGISVLTENALDIYIPGEVFNIAVNAGWIEPHEVAEGKGPVLGDYIVEDDQRNWFMNLLADSLSDLKEGAVKCTEQVNQLVEDRNNAAFDLLAQAVANADAAPSKGRGLAREKIDGYIRLSEEVFDIKEFVLQKVAPVARRYKRGVSLASVWRIYHGNAVGPSIRQIVAEALSELVPCTRDDLLPLDENQQDDRETT